MNDIYQVITDRIIASLEKGIIPWKKEWRMPKGHTVTEKYETDDTTTYAYNGCTGHMYTMLNQCLLGKGGAWATIKQINALKGRVNAGEKASTVVFWDSFTKTVKKDDGTEEEKTIWTLKYYNVFHIASQTTGIDPKKLHLPIVEYTRYIQDTLEKEWASEEKADKILNDYFTSEHITVANDGGNRAFYQPATDSIHIPTEAQFKTAVGYYGTLFHETVHSTGDRKRLNRDILNSFGDTGYAKEELVAEIGASFLNGIFELTTDHSSDNNTAYIQSWLTRLKNDKTLIVSASTKAEKAVKYILGQKPTTVENED